MPELCGWSGTILRVDLTNGKTKREPLPEESATKFLGGRGLNMKVLWEEIPRGIDPLGPQNVLCLATGPLAGTIALSNGRYSISAKSPYTGHLGDSNVGGHWATELKNAGYDQIVITGRAAKPTYLWIADDHVELRDASHLWGKTSSQTDEAIRRELGDAQIKVATCLPAGENLVRMAAVISERHRAGGRTGMGAVMGSKNLKAIAVRGHKGVKVAEAGKLAETVAEHRDWASESPDLARYSLLGTAYLYPALEPWTNNYQSFVFPQLQNLYGTTLLEKYVVRRSGCFSCAIGCGRFHDVTSGPYRGRGAGPEFEAIAHLGPKCGNSDLASICYMNDLCNEYGLDTISTGVAISCAMEWWQRGLITQKDTDGIPLEWGNQESMVTMIHKIAKREGFGGVLAEGPLRAAEVVGGHAEEYVAHVLGMCHYDLREGPLVAIAWVTSTRGCDHLRGGLAARHTSRYEGFAELLGVPGDEADKMRDPTTPYGKHLFAIYGQHQSVICDCLPLCKFASRPPVYQLLPKLVSAATGCDMSHEELLAIAERVYNLEQAFLVREGITRRDFGLPRRFATEPIPDGALQGSLVEQEVLDEMLNNYYQARGWDVETGVPGREKLEELDLGQVADELEALAGRGEIGVPTDYLTFRR